MDQQETSPPTDQRGVGANIAPQSDPELSAKISPTGRMPDPCQAPHDLVLPE